MLELRPYQRAALDAVYTHLRTRTDNPCVVIPTGGGKTPLLATLCRDVAERWNGRILVLSHVKELLEQAANHLASFLPMNMVGMHSAGLGRRDTEHPVIVAGIQTVADKADEMGPFNIIIVDEAHRLPESGEGQYLTFIRDAKVVNPKVRIVGLTATPYRLGTGRLCKPGNVLNHVCYEADVKRLILDGWLSPLRTRRGMECANLDNVHIASTGDFASDEMQKAFESIVAPACAEIMELCADRRSVLIFSAGVEHARMVAETVGGELVTGATSKQERADIIARFRAGDIKYLVNVNVLTTGFDAPNVDAVVLLRATMSPGLYCQMVGRGLRKCEGKTDCLVLDYGDNAVRHGPIDCIEVRDRRKGKRDEEGEPPGKTCPECREVIVAQYRICPNCGHEFPAPLAGRHNRTAGDAPILSEKSEAVERQVLDVRYGQNVKDRTDGTKSVTLRVEYILNMFINDVVREYICLDYPPGSYQRRRAEEWWRLRSAAPVPDTAMDALYFIEKGALAKPKSIRVIYGGKKDFPKIVGLELDEIPEWHDESVSDEDFFAKAPAGGTFDFDDIPF